MPRSRIFFRDKKWAMECSSHIQSPKKGGEFLVKRWHVNWIVNEDGRWLQCWLLGESDIAVIRICRRLVIWVVVVVGRDFGQFSLRVSEALGGVIFSTSQLSTFTYSTFIWQYMYCIVPLATQMFSLRILAAAIFTKLLLPISCIDTSSLQNVLIQTSIKNVQ